METTRNEIIRKLARVHAILKSENLNDEAYNLCCEILDYWKQNNTSTEEMKAMRLEAERL